MQRRLALEEGRSKWPCVPAPWQGEEGCRSGERLKLECVEEAEEEEAEGGSAEEEEGGQDGREMEKVEQEEGVACLSV